MRPKSPERPTTTPNSVKQRPERRGTAHDTAKKDCHMRLVDRRESAIGDRAASKCPQRIAEAQSFFDRIFRSKFEVASYSFTENQEGASQPDAYG